MKTTLQIAWYNMRDRCLNPNHPAYPRYGGRGIKICARWASFELFRQDMEPTWKFGLEIERKDNNGDYSPENCRWATRYEQSINRGTNTETPGVSFDSHRGYWKTRVTSNGKRKTLYNGPSHERALAALKEVRAL